MIAFDQLCVEHTFNGSREQRVAVEFRQSIDKGYGACRGNSIPQIESGVHDRGRDTAIWFDILGGIEGPFELSTLVVTEDRGDAAGKFSLFWDSS